VPTGHHFDPQVLHLRASTQEGLAAWRSFSWLTPLEETIHACPGLVSLQDRKDRRVHFYTFGGSLDVTAAPGEHVYSLRSPAPLLRLSEPEESIPDWLAAETGALVARARAKWDTDEAGFGLCLASADPLLFYIATLKSILARREADQLPEETAHGLSGAVLLEKEWLIQHHEWRSSPSSLLELLAPPHEETA
jgi:hypothetical protein